MKVNQIIEVLSSAKAQGTSGKAGYMELVEALENVYHKHLDHSPLEIHVGETIEMILKGNRVFTDEELDYTKAATTIHNEVAMFIEGLRSLIIVGYEC